MQRIKACAAALIGLLGGETPMTFMTYVKSESERWGKVARESGASID